jgi:hypothetical protein
MGFLRQIRLGRWIVNILLKLFGNNKEPTNFSRFKIGDMIRRKRPAHMEDWEIWDGQDPLEILAVGREHYKVWYVDSAKYKSTYSKMDISGNPYINWSITQTDKDYEKIGTSPNHVVKVFDKDLEDLLDE